MRRRNIMSSKSHALNRTRRRRKQLKNIRSAQQERRLIFFMQENDTAHLH